MEDERFVQSECITPNNSQNSCRNNKEDTALKQHSAEEQPKNLKDDRETPCAAEKNFSEASLPPVSSQSNVDPRSSKTHLQINDCDGPQSENNPTKHFENNYNHCKEDHGESVIDSTVNPQVLDPDNPLMQKFQKALTELLRKQLSKLSQEVSELSNNLKSKAKKREDLGVNLFNLQEEVTHSQRQITSYNTTLAELDKTRLNLEEELSKLKAEHKEESQKMCDIQAQEESVRLEMEMLKSVEWQLKQWESDYYSELAVSQRIADKSEKQKEEMAKEKQRQDILLLRLRQAVLGLESKREQLKAQREVKLQQQESLQRTIADGTADLEALQTEQIRLTRIWNGVVINLQQRDKVYSTVQKDLQKAKEAFQSMVSEIEGYRRLAKVEMLENEKTMIILDRLQTEYDDLEKTHNKNKELISELEADYSYMSGIMKKTEDNLQSVLMDGKVLTQQSLYQRSELENLTNKKVSLEMQILEKIQYQSKHDKAFQHMVRTIKKLKDSNKSQEMTFIMMENQIAKTMVEIEKSRGAIVCNENLLQEAKNEAEKYAHELSQLEASVKRSTHVLENKMQLLDQLTKKLDGILAHSAVTEESPQEVRIKAIELEIEETSQEAEKKQAFWLRLQSHIVRLTEDRQRQLQQLNLLYKQIHILNQRSLKIEHEVEKHLTGKRDVEHQIHELDVALNKMTVGLYNKRGHKEILDKENMIIQTEALGLLKELEEESVNQEEELTNLEDCNLVLNREILDIKRDCLAWEKKILIASETKQMHEEDNKANGELGKMKIEIHRMDVRFSHLRKVQETLGKDLEHCIMRRESLLDEADAREKRSMGNSVSISNRIVYERKLENLSNRKKQAKMETKHISSQLENELPEKLSELQAALVEAEESLQREEQALATCRSKVDEAHLMKQQKLEMLVRLQKKVRLYSKVKEGKHRLLYRAESALDAEMSKQRAMTSDLLDIVSVLQQHFPLLQLQIVRLSNILHVPST